MGGLVLLLNRDGSPVESDVFSRMMDRLAHRGLDGCAEWRDDSVALGHQSF